MKRRRSNAMLDGEEDGDNDGELREFTNEQKRARIYTSESPSINMVQQQLESFTFASPNLTMNPNAMFDSQNDMQDEELLATSLQQQLKEKRIYNVDLQSELVLRNALDIHLESDLVDYKMKKRMQFDRIEFDYENGMFQIFTRPISGITECVTPKTEKLMAIFCESFDQLQTRYAAVPLRATLQDATLVLQGAIQYIQMVFENGHYRVTIEQWLDGERNKESDSLETVFYKKRIYQSVQQIPNVSLYLQFCHDLSTACTSFEEIAYQYLTSNRRDFAGFNLLMHYACRNDVDATRRLMEIGYDLRDTDNMGYNTMYWIQHFAALDVLKSIIERENPMFSVPAFPLRVQVDDPSRLQLNEYNWKHFYLSKFNNKCVIRCKQIIPKQQELRIRICNNYEGYIELTGSHEEADKYELQFSNYNYTGNMIVQLYDRYFERVLAESEPITVYDTSSIYLLMCSDVATRKTPVKKVQNNFKGLFFKNAATKLNS
jgi:hypothetical protein